jgi:histidine triad (HIT) family protein
MDELPTRSDTLRRMARAARSRRDDCRFCGIVSGDLDGHGVLEDANSCAFLDNRPLFPGHSLLVPIDHYETLLDIPDQLIQELFANARLLARAMETALGAEGSFVAVNNRVSQSVPHLHVHVVPRTKGDGLRGFFWPRQKYRDDSHLAATRDALSAAVAELRS